VYSLLAKFNNYDQFLQTFERNNFNAEFNCKSNFSAQTRAISRWHSDLDVAGRSWPTRKTEVSAAVPRQDAPSARARCRKGSGALELQLAQQNLPCCNRNSAKAANLREVEKLTGRWKKSKAGWAY